MRTEALIRALAADAAPRAGLVPVLAAVLAAGAAAVAVVGLSLLGINPDLGAMLSGHLLLLRQVVPVLAALGAGAAALRLARPGAGVGNGWLLLAAALVLAAAVLASAMLGMPARDWGRAAMGSTPLACLASISAMGLGLLPAVLWALGRGASTRPRLSGALAGLLCGAVAAEIYALHCPEASPLFYVSWYGLALALLAGIGALLGRRLLRW
jgi:hypothetical protein